MRAHETRRTFVDGFSGTEDLPLEEDAADAAVFVVSFSCVSFSLVGSNVDVAFCDLPLLFFFLVLTVHIAKPFNTSLLNVTIEKSF